MHSESKPQSLGSAAGNGMSGFPDMPSFNLEQAFMRLGGRADILKRAMTAFAEYLNTARPQVDSFFSQQSWDDLRLLTHSIKGSASNIGADSLADMAARVEAKIKQAEAVLAQDCAQLNAAIDRVCAEIALLSAAGANAAQVLAQSSVDYSQLVTIAQRVKQNLYRDLGQVTQDLEVLVRLSAGTSHAERCVAIQNAFKLLRFAEMERLIGEWPAA